MIDQNIDGKKILIVDDLEANRLILEEIIDEMGASPILAENGLQALELVKEHKPQLILSDISMPEMDGYELCRILKRDVETQHIPIVFISAFDDAKDIVKGFRLGGEDYITKPFIPEVVKARVGVQLRLYEAQNKLLKNNRLLQISVSEQVKQMELEKKNVLYALTNVSLQNSDEKEEYLRRLKNNCRTMAQAMQLSLLFEARISDTYIDAIELAAPIRDIGNIGVPMEILKKREDLTEDEMTLMKRHTTIGAELLSDLYVNSSDNEFISIAIDIIRFHHEHWDGSGYPEGLKGEEIPLAARIVAIMERYTKLTEDGACSREEALECMQKEAGSKFDPDIFTICKKISRQFR